MLSTKKTALPTQPPTIGEAVKCIGCLGGHLGRKSDEPPGVKVIWRGYRKLMAAVELYEMLQKINRTNNGKNVILLCKGENKIWVIGSAKGEGTRILYWYKLQEFFNL